MDIYVYKFPDVTSGFLAYMYMKLGVVLCNTSIYLFDRSFRAQSKSQLLYRIYAYIIAP